MRVIVPSEEIAGAIAEAGVDVETVVWRQDSADEVPAGELLIGVRPSNPEASERLGEIEGLRHIHVPSLGFEWVEEYVPEGVTLSNSAGTIEEGTAELTLAMILAVLREIPQAVDQQREGRWDAGFTASSLQGARVLMLGYGGVGQAIARRIEAFAPESITPVGSRAREENGTHIHGADELPELLPQADVVVVSLPHTDKTAGLVDADFLAAMPDGALLANIGRGPVVDTQALLAELSTERLRAALDVTDPEPLPDGHPLWSAPGCLILPHVGGATSKVWELTLDLIVEQTRRMAAGEDPRNIVER
ncbi:phosphoglycerate dehydrogenase-like enzyme [Bogoriella caseilytica]|uniref:Phosphoglycerate dehydrogenase-like enzyme n=1 Tax=Bogoriella caseilytica TaxID=56055 RepID=A0A3N2BDN7_9MICO|nr:phosphoglycerate dehydrogenase-like enzyme [Bogoriella caseilytica]